MWACRIGTGRNFPRHPRELVYKAPSVCTLIWAALHPATLLDDIPAVAAPLAFPPLLVARHANSHESERIIRCR